MYLPLSIVDYLFVGSPPLLFLFSDTRSSRLVLFLFPRSEFPIFVYLEKNYLYREIIHLCIILLFIYGFLVDGFLDFLLDGFLDFLFSVFLDFLLDVFLDLLFRGFLDFLLDRFLDLLLDAFLDFLFTDFDFSLDLRCIPKRIGYFLKQSFIHCFAALPLLL